MFFHLTVIPSGEVPHDEVCRPAEEEQEGRGVPRDSLRGYEPAGQNRSVQPPLQYNNLL